MHYDARTMLALMLLASSPVVISRNVENQQGTGNVTSIATNLRVPQPSLLPLVHQDSRMLLTPGQWRQLGEDFVGYSEGADFGRSVAMSRNGNRVAIGGWWRVTREFFIRLYEWDNASRSWQQMGTDIFQESDNDRIGFSLSLSGNGLRVATGAGFNPDEGPGNARVYHWDGSDWTPMGSPIRSTTDDDLFGASVSMSDDGNRLAIGAIKLAGRVEVYRWNGSAWIRMGAPIFGINFSELGTGLSMAGNGNRIAVGAPLWFNPITRDNGKVRVYEWNGSSWQQIGNDLGHGPMVEFGLGWAVALSRNGDRVAMGLSESEEFNGERTGIVRVYEQSGGSSWVRMGGDLFFDVDRYGRSISLSDDGQRLVIGEQTLGFARRGQAHIFEWNGTTWELMIELEGRTAQDHFGGDRWGVSMSGAGDRVIVGADFGVPLNCEGSTSDCRGHGYVQAFQFHPSRFPDDFSDTTCAYSSCLDEVLETFNRRASYTMFRTPEQRRYANSFRTKIHQAMWFIRNGGQILKSLDRLQQAMKFIEFLEEKKPLLSNAVGFAGSTCAIQFFRDSIRAFDVILSANFLNRMRKNQLAVARNLRTDKEWRQCVKRCRGGMWLFTNELGEMNVPVCLN